ACSRCDRPKRVKSGMLRESVDQKPIIAVTLGTKTGQNSPNVLNLPSSRMMLPSAEHVSVGGVAFASVSEANASREGDSHFDFALRIAHTTSSAVITRT